MPSPIPEEEPSILSITPTGDANGLGTQMYPLHALPQAYDEIQDSGEEEDEEEEAETALQVGHRKYICRKYVSIV